MIKIDQEINFQHFMLLKIQHSAIFSTSKLLQLIKKIISINILILLDEIKNKLEEGRFENFFKKYIKVKN